MLIKIKPIKVGRPEMEIEIPDGPIDSLMTLLAQHNELLAQRNRIEEERNVILHRNL